MSLAFPAKCCECGCGQPVSIAPRTRVACGWVKGFPIRFVKGHRIRPQDLPEIIPSGICECGCGQKTRIATESNLRHGIVKGRPLRYLRNHNRLVRPENLPPAPNPSGLCMCGCGAKTTIANRTSLKDRIAKGQARCFLPHHKPLGPMAHEINYAGICLCGCGKPTPIAQRNHAALGYRKGFPIRFYPTHSDAPLSARLWAHVDKNGPLPPHRPELGPCWIWTGSSRAKGYGRISDKRHSEVTHRVAFRLTYGPIPDGMWVLHKCDTRLCCRPSHLFLGTAKDNKADCIAKGRLRKKKKLGEILIPPAQQLSLELRGY